MSASRHTQPAPESPHARERRDNADRIGGIGIYLLAFGVWGGTALQTLGGLLVLAGFVASRDAWAWLRTWPLSPLLLLTGCYFLVRTGFAAWEFPDTSTQQWDAVGDWVELLLFFPVTWHLLRVPQRVPRALVLLAVGLGVDTVEGLARFGFPAPWDEAAIARFGGGLNKPLAYAFYVSTVMLGLLVYAPYWVRRHRAHGMGIAIGVTVLVLSCAVLILASKSRGPLLAAALVIPVTLLVRTLSNDGHGEVRGWTALALVLAGLPLLWLLGSGVEQRFVAELPHVVAIVTGDTATLEYSSTTARFAMWQFGLEHWWQRPLAGWGPGSVQYLEARVADPLLRAPDGVPFDHLHSAYVQTLFTFGAVGAVMLASLLGAFVQGAWRRLREPAHRLLALLVLGNLALVALFSLTDFRHLNHDWTGYWLMLAGIAGTLCCQRPAAHGHRGGGRHGSSRRFGRSVDRPAARHPRGQNRGSLQQGRIIRCE